jgi:hypothetical protein
MERRLQCEQAGDVMKLKVSAACFSLLLVALSSLTAQGINPEVVRLNA